MPWSFELSLLAFLLIVFASQSLAIATKSRISLPLALGALCVAGFALGVLPKDFVSASRMRDVGFIAFNVLIVHSGTLLDFKSLRARRGAVAIGLACAAALAVVLGLGMSPVVGREAALLSIGPVVGGGAACAIASNSAIRKLPGLAALPWMIFMAQGFFGLPLFAFATRKEAGRLAALRASGTTAGSGAAAQPRAGARVSADSASVAAGLAPSRAPLCERIPGRYRTISYYLAALMLVAVFNRWLYGAVFMRLGVHPALTGLVLGALLARLGILERDPLVKSGAMGFLMLGLMALMADSLAATPPGVVLALAGPTLAVLAVGASVVGLVGAALGKRFAGSAYRGLAIASACMISMPPPMVVARGVIGSVSADDGTRAAIEAELAPDVEAASALVTNFAAIAIAGLVGILL
ncbi:MAG: hypothetical protein KKA67_09035 [Spirochaetes bacterium]|nr:hypothetical protein [Spirochaetota bacterium]